MEFRALAAELKKGTASPVYLVYGFEALLRERALEMIRAAEPEPGFQVIRISPSESGWAAIADELYTGTFLGGRKLVVLADEGNFVHNQREGFKAYAAAPSASAVLVALVPSEKAPGLPESATVRHVECRPLRANDLSQWVESEFRRRGKTADHAAIAALLDRCAGPLGVLAGHVETLSLYAGGRPRVTAGDVAGLVTGRPEHEVYELALAAASKKAGRALEIAHRLLAAGEAAPLLLWKLAWQYRKLVEAKKLIEGGKRKFEVTSLLQITYYPDEFLRLVDGHSLEELLEKHGAILETDVALKTSGGMERVLMERLVVRLAAAPAVGAGVR